MYICKPWTFSNQTLGMSLMCSTYHLFIRHRQKFNRQITYIPSSLPVCRSIFNLVQCQITEVFSLSWEMQKYFSKVNKVAVPHFEGEYL